METIQINILSGTWHIVVGIFSCIALLAVWKDLTTENQKKKTDRGLLWLAISIGVWSLMGVVYLLIQDPTDLKREIIISILSIANSYLILMSLPFFVHKPPWFRIRTMLKSEFYRPGVTIITSIILLFLLEEIIRGDNSVHIYMPDLILGLPTIFLLVCVLVFTFRKRNMPILVALSVVAMVITLIAQLTKFGDLLSEEWNWTLIRNTLGLIFMTMLIMIFFALALSWVKEKPAFSAKEIYPSDIFMHVLPVKPLYSQIADKYLVAISFPRYGISRVIEFNRAPFTLLLEFIHQLQTRENKKGGYLHTETYGFQTNQVNKIVEPIVSELRNDKFDEKKQEHKDARTALREILFETKNGGYRLRIEPDNINGIVDLRTELPWIIKKLKEKSQNGRISGPRLSDGKDSSSRKAS